MQITMPELALVLVIALFSLTACGEVGSKQDSMLGYWEGNLQVPGGSLRVGLHVAKLEDGGYSAKLDSPDQGAFGLGVDEFTVDGAKVTFRMKALGVEYEGTLSTDGREIVGKFRQSGLTMDLVLKKTDRPIKSRRPQEPIEPFPYHAEDVTFANERAGIRLAGTLTLPKNATRVPAVVLVSGSGPQDRDETLLGHKPFLVLSDYLTRRGIAVLRFDDRGVGKSEGNFATATMEDFVTDSLAAVEYLRAREEIDSSLIGIAGHSEGGIVAPIAAVRSPHVAFINLLAAPAVTGEEILYAQSELIARAGGADEEEVKRARQAQEKIFRIVKQVGPPSKHERELKALVPELVAALSEREKEQLAGRETEYIQAQMKMVSSPWFRHFLTYDPAPALRKVRVPVLALYGELDLQVPPKQNLPVIDRELRGGVCPSFEVHELKGLNHLFQTAETGSPTEYARIEETMSPVVMSMIADWILKLKAGPKARTHPAERHRARER